MTSTKEIRRVTMGDWRRSVYNRAMGEARSHAATMIVDFCKGSRTVCMTLHGTQTPSDAEWDTVLEGMRRFGKENGNDLLVSAASR